MLNDIRESEGNRREWIVEVLKDIEGMHTGYLHKGELVRCKDCEYYDDEEYGETTRWCVWHESPVQGEDYCSYGKRCDK